MARQYRRGNIPTGLTRQQRELEFLREKFLRSITPRRDIPQPTGDEADPVQQTSKATIPFPGVQPVPTWPDEQQPGNPGQLLHLRSPTGTVISPGPTLRLAEGPWTAQSAQDMLSLVSDGRSWNELARAVPAGETVFVPARRFGAIPGTGADMTTRIQDAFDKCPIGCTLVFEPGTYQISATLDWLRRFNIWAYGAVFDLGTTALADPDFDSAIQIRPGSNGSISCYGLEVTRTAAPAHLDVSSLKFAGFRFLNVGSGIPTGSPVGTSGFHQIVATNFKRGLYLNATGSVTNCSWYNYRVRNCLYGVEIGPSGTGDANENTFVGGQHQIVNPDPWDQETRETFFEHVRLIASGTATVPNNNRFISCEFLGEAKRKVRCEGRWNTFQNCRYEFLKTMVPGPEITIGVGTKVNSTFIYNSFQGGHTWEDIINSFSAIEYLSSDFTGVAPLMYQQDFVNTSIASIPNPGLATDLITKFNERQIAKDLDILGTSSYHAMYLDASLNRVGFGVTVPAVPYHFFANTGSGGHVDLVRFDRRTTGTAVNGEDVTLSFALENAGGTGVTSGNFRHIMTDVTAGADKTAFAFEARDGTGAVAKEVFRILGSASSNSSGIQLSFSSTANDSSTIHQIDRTDFWGGLSIQPSTNAAGFKVMSIFGTAESNGIVVFDDGATFYIARTTHTTRDLAMSCAKTKRMLFQFDPGSGTGIDALTIQSTGVDFGLPGTYRIFDTVNNATTQIVGIYHNLSSGSAAAGIGSEIAFQTRNSGSGTVQSGGISNIFEVVTAGSEDASTFFTVRDGGTFKEIVRMEGATPRVVFHNSTTPGSAPTPEHILDCTGAAVFNEQGRAKDFRVEVSGAGNSNMLLVQDQAGSAGLVGIRKGSPAETLHVGGNIRADTSLMASGDRGSGVTGVTTISNVAPVVGGGASTATFGANGVNGTGLPANIAQAGWLKVYVGTTTAFVPYWT